jgi:hypothetical protein
MHLTLNSGADNRKQMQRHVRAGAFIESTALSQF